MDIKRLYAYLLQAFLNAGDFFARTTFYNREMPQTGEHTIDVPYGDHPQQRLDIIRPQTNPPKASIIYIHGGGWIMGNKASYTRVCSTWAAQGYLVFNLNYRLAPRYPYRDQLQDLADGIALAYQKIKEIGTDPHSVFLAGDSAGAHLMSWYAAALQAPELFSFASITNPIPADAIRGLLLFYGAYNLQTSMSTGFPWIKTFIPSFVGKHADARTFQMLSPIHHITADYPATFLCVSENDQLLSENRAFRDRLLERGIEVEYMLLSKQEYPRAYHGFINHYVMSFAKKAMQESLAFLAQHA